MQTTNEKLTEALTYSKNQKEYLSTFLEDGRIPISNNHDVYEYLKYLLEEMSNNDHIRHPEVLNQYLPWSDELPDQCRLKQRIESASRDNVIRLT